MKKSIKFLAIAVIAILVSCSKSSDDVKAVAQIKVTTLTGRIPGDNNGNLTNALFNRPRACAFDLNGNLYVADTFNHKIKVISTSGTVSTYAGSTQGDINDALLASKFSNPQGLCFDLSGNLVISDTSNHKIKKTTVGNMVFTFAGSTQGGGDANGTNAKFNNLKAICINSQGTIFIADKDNNTIRKLAPNGDVTNYGGSGNFYSPEGICVDTQGDIYISDTGNHKIKKINTSGTKSFIAGSVDGPGDFDGTAGGAKFNNPKGITIDPAGNLYVADTANHKIKKITPAGVVTTLAGSTDGFADGEASAAKFSSPEGVTFYKNKLYVCDTGNSRIRVIENF